MRLCRYQDANGPAVGFYSEETIVPAAAAAKAYTNATHETVSLPAGDNLLPFLPPAGEGNAAAKKIASWLEHAGAALPAVAKLATAKTQLLVPIPRPISCFYWRATMPSIFAKGAVSRPNGPRRFRMSS